MRHFFFDDNSDNREGDVELFINGEGDLHLGVRTGGDIGMDLEDGDLYMHIGGGFGIDF